MSEGQGEKQERRGGRRGEYQAFVLRSHHNTRHIRFRLGINDVIRVGLATFLIRKTPRKQQVLRKFQILFLGVTKKPSYKMAITFLVPVLLERSNRRAESARAVGGDPACSLH